MDQHCAFFLKEAFSVDLAGNPLGRGDDAAPGAATPSNQHKKVKTVA